VFGPLVLALGFVAAAFRIARGKSSCSLHHRLGAVQWDLSTSFGSSLTVFAALLGSILTAGVLPDTSSVPRGTYAGLNLLFGVIVIVGPFLYCATMQTPDNSGDAEPQGFVISFLVTSVMTLWAVVGEFATIGAVFNEIRGGGSMPAAILWVLCVVLAASGGFLYYMAWHRIKTALERATGKELPRVTVF
jgi:hypothetical protein